MYRLGRKFFTRDAVDVAKELIGAHIVHKIGDVVYSYRITETEAYRGEDDTACHAHKGKTARTAVLYEEGGLTYIYLCYGIHNLLNVVTGEKDSPQAVLIRCVEGFNGPGKLTKAMKIDRSLNAVDLTLSDEIWIESDGEKAEFTADTRVGINYADEKDIARKWRFILKSE